MAISTKYIKTTSVKQISKLNTFNRSNQSKLLEQVHVYSMDLERVTLLRNRAFKHKNYDTNQGFAEWESYNKLIELMVTTMIKLHKDANKTK